MNVRGFVLVCDVTVVRDVSLLISRYISVAIIGGDGNFFRGGAGPQFSPRRGRDFST